MKQVHLLRKYWEQFIFERMINPSVRPEIARSWQRCREAGVDPYSGCGAIAPPKIVEKLLSENAELISVARPIMQNLYNTLQGQKTIMFLSNANGYILSIVGKQEDADLIDQMNMKEGVRWLEEDVGTNGLALCLEYDCPMDIFFSEHYCQRQHIGACNASPIHGESGRLIGVLVLISLYESKQSKSVVIAGANLIEGQIALSNSKSIVENIVDTMREGIIVMDGDLKIIRINSAAQKILAPNTLSYIGTDIRQLGDSHTVEALRPNQDTAFEFNLQNRRVSCVGIYIPMFFNKIRAGAMLVFSEEKRIASIANKMTGNQATYHFRDIITQNVQMNAAIAQCRTIAATDCNVLITGESGTGKELFAQSIHNESKRSNGPFIAINCAALPRELVESEIFGYEGGAFTGAKKEGQTGKFELANGGTLFLDEVGELPLEIQSKLLRVLDNHKITRIGGKNEKDIDVRIITATNRNLEKEVHKNNFRLDLLYRINVFTVHVIPLRQRDEDVTLLADYFLTKLNRNCSRQIEGATEEFYAALKNCTWEGNVRQLQNVIARAFFLCSDRQLDIKHLPEELITLSELPANTSKFSDKLSIDATLGDAKKAMLDTERSLFLQAIRATGGNMSRAAEQLGIGRTTLYRKLQLMGINPAKAKEVQ